LGSTLGQDLWNDAPMPLATSRRADGARVAASTLTAAAVLAAFPVVIALVRHDGSPIGADTPVYVWWARLVGSAGASAVAFRPGVPDVSEIVARAVGLSELATVAGLGCALVAMVGLAGSASLRSAGRTGATPLLGLVLTGLFGTYLAAGHLSNAAFAALFLVSIAFLLDGRPASVTAAALALGAAGIAHPDFLWLSLAILLGAGALALIARRRREALVTALAAVVGAGVTGVGLLAASTGGVAFDVPTSLDVFLLQTRQLARLHALFLERFSKVAGYALWAWLPLAAVAYRRLRGHLGRILVAWSAVTVAGVVVGLVWQPFPPHRIVAFAFCLPLLAALGLTEIRAKLPRWAMPISLVVVAGIAAGAVWLWVQAPRPFTDPSAAPLAAVVPAIGTTTGPVVVDLPLDGRATAVQVIRAINLLRAAVPGDRVRDVLVRYPAPVEGDADAISLWQTNQAQLAAAEPAAEVVAPVDAPAHPAVSAGGLLVATLAWLAVCGVVGDGWCVALGQRGVRLLERSAGTGLAGLILAGSLADRAGLRLGNRATAVGVVLGVTVAGAVVATVVSSRARRRGGQPARGATTTRSAHGALPSLDRSGTT
jgi:hypothetical protein